MVLKKLFFTVLILVASFFFLAKATLAQGEFQTDVAAEYRVEATGKTLVTNTVTIENAYSDLYATAYTWTLGNIQVENLKATQAGKPLRFTQKTQGEDTIITINFDDAVVGKGRARTLLISYENNSFVQRTGEVWEVAIPRLSPTATFRNYRVTLSIPTSFGLEAYLSPKAQEKKNEDGRIIYLFGKDEIAKTGITAGFGAFQVFSFNLNYHLENPLAKTVQTEVALPPDTALQRVYYQTISPKPENVELDPDGNWIATFTLKPRERVDVKAAGSVQIFAGPRPFPKPSSAVLALNLKPSEFWQTNDSQIKDLARRLGSAKAIYDFVWQNLSYDYERVKPNVVRLGAKQALNNPKNAICMEFTDLFIALARAAGIPAREINGFAYTENPKIQPLSLVADVLHSWPEYWNSTKGSWIAVDPTWASTTGGVDYFTKLDLRHFAFVIHGTDAGKPYPPGSYKLGPNPQKDVFVNFGQLPEKRDSQPTVAVEVSKFFPFRRTKLLVKVTNPGPVALYNLTAYVAFDKEVKEKTQIEALPPLATYELASSIPFSFLGRSTPDKVTIVAGDKQVDVPTYKNEVIVYNLVSLFLLFSILIVVVLIRLKKIRIAIDWAKFKSFFKNAKQPPQNNQGQL